MNHFLWDFFKSLASEEMNTGRMGGGQQKPVHVFWKSVVYDTECKLV